jgi:hypothetical protein
MLNKKIWASFQRIIELFTKKFGTQLKKIWGWDPGSEIRDPEKNLFDSDRNPDSFTAEKIPDRFHYYRKNPGF